MSRSTPPRRPNATTGTSCTGPSRARSASGTSTEVNFETTHFSNVNSAIPRSLLLEFPFAEDLIMSEDHEWSRRMLLAGYSIVYEPRAVVVHSHEYSIAGAFRRFFDSGVTADRSFLGESREARAVMRRASARYAQGELAWLWRTGRRRWIPYATVYELAKFAGSSLAAVITCSRAL